MAKKKAVKKTAKRKNSLAELLKKAKKPKPAEPAPAPVVEQPRVAQPPAAPSAPKKTWYGGIAKFAGIILALLALVVLAYVLFGNSPDGGSKTTDPNSVNVSLSTETGVVPTHRKNDHGWAIGSWNRDEITIGCVKDCDPPKVTKPKEEKVVAKRQSPTVVVVDPWARAREIGKEARETPIYEATIVLIPECSYESECGQRASQFKMIFQVGIGYVYEDIHFKGKYFRVPASHEKKIGAHPPYKDHGPPPKKVRQPKDPTDPGCQGDCGTPGKNKGPKDGVSPTPDKKPVDGVSPTPGAGNGGEGPEDGVSPNL